MIIGFSGNTGGKWADEIFNGHIPNGFPTDVVRTARRKLLQLDASIRIDDLRAPPGNHLEKLRGDRIRQWSVRINDKWRICFGWKTGGASGVEITDYH